MAGLGEHLARLADAQVDQVLDEADPGLALEEVAEGGLRHVDAGSHVAQMDGLLEVLVNIIAYLRDAPALGDAHDGLRVVDMLHQLPLFGYGEQVQDLQKLDHRLEAVLRGEVEQSVADIKDRRLGEAEAVLRVVEQLTDLPEEPLLQHGEVEHLLGELDGDHMVAIHHLTLPRMRDMGTDHHQVERGETLLRVAHDTGAMALHHQVDLVVGVVVHRVVELGRRVVQDNKQVIVRQRCDLLVKLFHLHNQFL